MLTIQKEGGIISWPEIIDIWPKNIKDDGVSYSPLIQERGLVENDRFPYPKYPVAFS